MSDIERQIRDQLRAREQQLDQDTLEHLRFARERAVSRAGKFRLPRVILPLGGMTLASIAIFFLVLSPLHQSNNNPARPALSADSKEAQDLDFYYWLAENQDVIDS